MSHIYKWIILSVSFSLFLHPSWANKSSNVKEVTSQLKDPDARSNLAGIEKAENYLSGATEDQKNKAFAASAEIFEAFAEANENDPEKMEAALKAANQDPETFFNSLPENKKEQFRKIASELIESGVLSPR